MLTTPMNRDGLHDMLVEVLGNDHVYYDPPESVKMKNPAIRYIKNHVNSTNADNSTYLKNYIYTITFMCNDPDSEIVDKILELPMCKHNQHFMSGNLYHDVFTIKF